MELAAAVAPTTFARQRTLPVSGPLIPLLPDGALPCGRAVSCGGIAATSLAVALAAEAVVAGSWLAVVDVPWLGVEAVAELGVPLQRLVRVDPGSEHDGSWADLVAAVLDGFEIVITRMPRRLSPAVVRRVQARVQAREGVLITVGGPGPLLADITMEASSPVWEGVEHGWGRLRGRRITVSATGRRVPRPRRVDLWLPGPDGTVATASSPVVPLVPRRVDMTPARRTASARRMVTVWCPDWPVVAAGVAADVPVIVLHANRVVARTPAAAVEGVAIGQRRREAQQRCPDVVLLDHDPDRDARAFEPVVRAVGRFAPRLEVIEPGWLSLGARGPSRYFGGDGPLAEQVVAAIGTTVGVGIADGRFASAVAAWRGVRAPRVVAPGGSPGFLAPLPVAWLRHVGGVDDDLVGLFARLGLARLGELAALPEGDVLARFGPPGRYAHRLAGGDDDRPAGGVEPPPERRVQQTFDDPVLLLEPLVFVGKHLADELVSGLAAEGRVCTRLVVTAETDHGERSERAWYRAAGMSAPAMVERVRWQLDAWMASGDLTAGIVLLRLMPAEVRGDDGDQLRLWGGPSAADERATRTVARLTGMVGDRAVLVPAWRGGRLPGDRYDWVSASTTDLTDADDTAERLRPRLGPGPVGGVGQGPVGGGVGPWPGSLPTPSPAVVPPEMQPAELTDAGGRVVEVSGRGELSAEPVALAIAGRSPQAITGWAGPWPLDERWWEPRRHRRLARFQVVTADGAAHLVLAEHRTWWVAASYG